MKSIRMVVGAVVALVFVLSTSSTPASGGPTGNAVTAWNQIAVDTLVGLPGPAGGAPPAAAVHVAMVQGAVYDAVNAIEPKHHRPYLLKRRFSARPRRTPPSQPRRTPSSRNIVSTVPNLTGHGASRGCCDSLAGQYATALAAIPDGRSRHRASPPATLQPTR